MTQKTQIKERCSMIGCKESSYQALTIAPGTVLTLCLKHYVEEGGVVDEELVQTGSHEPS